VPSGGALIVVEFEGGEEGCGRCRDAEEVFHLGWTRRERGGFTGPAGLSGLLSPFAR
jgi:hypothetical protein